MTSAEIEKIFKGKKITLMGLGLLGRGVGDAEFLAKFGAELIVTDLKTEAELAPSIARLKSFSNVIYHLGGHRLEDFENRDMILRAPNVPLDSPFLARAREKNIPIEMDASLFAKLSGASTVGITGTRGKSTVTHMIFAMAEGAGKKPWLGGNERNISTLSLLETTNPGDLVILELDSWQLQGFEETKLSPRVAVWTNFMRDHMNYYKNDMERYFRDKAAIARFQKPGDFFIAPREIKEKIEATFGPLSGTFEPSSSALPKEWSVKMPGEHNRANARAAAAAARALGIREDIIKATLTTFSGLPNRLEFLTEKDGVEYYNDGNSTTPEATIAAIKTLTEKNKPIVLIAGGSDKELDFKILAGEIEKNTKGLVFFKGNATEKLKTLLPSNFSFIMADDMQAAFAAARTLAKPGSIILLSPGATSFGIFKNEYDRADQFRALVMGLK